MFYSKIRLLNFLLTLFLFYQDILSLPLVDIKDIDVQPLSHQTPEPTKDPAFVHHQQQLSHPQHLQQQQQEQQQGGGRYRSLSTSAVSPGANMTAAATGSLAHKSISKESQFTRFSYRQNVFFDYKKLHTHLSKRFLKFFIS